MLGADATQVAVRPGLRRGLERSWVVRPCATKGRGEQRSFKDSHLDLVADAGAYSTQGQLPEMCSREILFEQAVNKLSATPMVSTFA